MIGRGEKGWKRGGNEGERDRVILRQTEKQSYRVIQETDRDKERQRRGRQRGLKKGKKKVERYHLQENSSQD